MFPPRAREAADQSGRDGISNGRHDDGDRPGRLLGSLDRWHGPRYDDVDLQTDQLGGEGGKAFVLSLRQPDLNSDVLPLRVAKVAQPLPERLESILGRRVSTGAWV